MNTSRISTQKILLKLEIDDDIEWQRHKIPGLTYLKLLSGSSCVLGREPILRRNILGVMIFSSLISSTPSFVVLKSKKNLTWEASTPMEDTINPIRAYFTVPLDAELTHEYATEIIRGLREQISLELRKALDSRSIHGISYRDMNRWITTRREILPDTGETRIIATSRPLPVNLIRFANQ